MFSGVKQNKKLLNLIIKSVTDIIFDLFIPFTPYLYRRNSPQDTYRTLLLSESKE